MVLVLHIYFCFLQEGQIQAVVQKCSVNKVFLKVSQNSQENTSEQIFKSSKRHVHRTSTGPNYGTCQGPNDGTF